MVSFCLLNELFIVKNNDQSKYQFKKAITENISFRFNRQSDHNSLYIIEL
ncbi:MAG: hypothetical protein ACJA0X_002539 [Cyclobacteriaceae bacterium]|jgi:hypothetical protein